MPNPSNSGKMEIMKTIKILKDDEGIKLHKWLRKEFPKFPLSAVHKALRTKKIRVNGFRAKGDEVLKENDEVAVYFKEEVVTMNKMTEKQRFLPTKAAAEKKFNILYEDDDVVAIAKPAGLAVHPGSGTAQGRSAIDFVSAYFPDLTPRLVHRLDKDTSGVLLIAKHGKALRKLLSTMRMGKFHKRYMTLVFGIIAENEGTIDIRLERQETGQKIIAGRGKSSITHFRVMKRFDDATLVEAVIETGRTHQIRAHFKAIGHPVCGDDQHGDFAKNRDFRKNFGLKRQFLHAAFLSFPHPETEKTIAVTCDLPDDLEQVLARMKAEGHDK